MNRRQKVERTARLLQDEMGVKIMSEKDVVNEVRRLLKHEHYGTFVGEEEDEKRYYLIGLNQRNGCRTLASEKRYQS
jgi:hypothetical protein